MFVKKHPFLGYSSTSKNIFIIVLWSQEKSGDGLSCLKNRVNPAQNSTFGLT